jgi:hypothetical protein
MTSSTHSKKLNVLVFAASLRKESLNKKLAGLAARIAQQLGANVDLASMLDFDVPLYNGDVEAMAHKAFDGDAIADATLQARFEKNVHAFLSLAEAAKHYPCIKRAWVEFLGEPPGAGADRVDPARP